jgi:hypothetical protein
MHNSSSDFSAILGHAAHLSNSISIMSDLEAEIISSKSSRLVINKGKLARLGGGYEKLAKLGGLGGVESLARILGLNSYIKELDLDECGLGDEGTRVIAEMLRVNSTLQVIDLSYNYSIGVKGALAIAEMLKVNSTLQVINLQNNRIGDDGARALAKAMKFNSSLQEINLSDNGIASEKLQLIDQALEGCINRRKQNARLWMCSFIGHWRAEQRLNFDNHMFAFSLYPLLGAELSK